MTMERTNEDAIALIDLGAASVETQGIKGPDFEPVGQQQLAGLSNED
jgi:hypothetical protein